MTKKKCIGCGVELQNIDKDKYGYVDNLEKEICERCFKLKNYGEYKTVSLTNKDYLKLLDTISNDNLVIYITDVLSLNLDYIDKFKKVILVITKKDILPKTVKDIKIMNYIKSKYNNLIDVIVVSTIHNYNIDNLYNIILKNNNNKFIYVVGRTNSGKSTLINKLIKNYTTNNETITTSPYPSTTLNKIPLTINELKIIDTPGLIDENSFINLLNKKDIKKLNIKKEIKPKTCQIENTGSILIDDYIRIDYKTKEKNSLVFYMSNNLNIRFNSQKNDKLKNLPHQELNIEKNKDIVIPDIGFIKITKEIKLKIYKDSKINIIIRDNLI